jgi:hypothetical protein
MTNLPSPSPYAYLDGSPPSERQSAIYLRHHRDYGGEDKDPLIGLARRARAMQAELVEVNKRATKLQNHGTDLQLLVDSLSQERDAYRSMVEEHAKRYSTGSQGRIALETLALAIKERS